MMDLRKPLAVLAVGGCLAVATTLFAQQQPKPAAPPAGQNPNAAAPARGQNDRAGWQNSDQTLATCVAIANQKEVALAQLVKDKLQSDDAKEFAQMMIKDHKAMLEKLQKFAPEASREGYLQQDQQSNRRDSQTTTQSGVKPAGGANPPATAGTIQQTAGTQATASNAQGVDFIQLHREIANECLASAKEKLSEKKDKDIDACFIGMQIAGHAMMLDKLTVFQRHSSGELKQLLADASETTQKHLDKAEKIMKDLADK